VKVAILGTIPYSKMQAPFDDHEWEIWVCSPGNRGGVIPRVTRWFELHSVDDMKGPENGDWNKPYFDWLNTQKFPVYMQEPNDLLSQCRVFPRMAWLKEFGEWGRMAATSSISLMIGYAIMSGADTIGVFGVDMQADEEQYTLQKAGCQIMLKLAKERGIQVVVPLSSCLPTMPPFYGYDESSRMGRRLKVRHMEVNNEIARVRGVIEQHIKLLENLTGQSQQLTYVRRTFVNGVEDAELDIDEEVVSLDGQNISVAHSKGTTVEFPDHRPITVVRGDETDPRNMDVVSVGGLLVPRGHASPAD
jgi:hypothetical protein